MFGTLRFRFGGRERFLLAVIVSAVAILLVPFLAPPGIAVAVMVVIVSVVIWLYPWLRFRMGPRRSGQLRETP